MTQPVKSPVSNPPFWMTPLSHGVGVDVGVGVGLAIAEGVGLGVGVGVGPGGAAQYFPPVLKKLPTPTDPPQTIISLPVQTTVCDSRAAGAFVVLVAVQLSVLGSYRPPVFKVPGLNPPQTTISLPVQTVV